MVLIFCDGSDIGALWAARELGARGVDVDIVSSAVLEGALRWDHRVGHGGAHAELELFDGRKIRTDAATGVLNRLSYVPAQRLRQVSDADADYATQEMQALFLSWLNCLHGPVVNRPTPQGLGGRWRPDSQWTALAASVGLPAVPFRQGSAETTPDPRAGRPVVTVFVVGERIVAPPSMPDAIGAGCLRLARAADAVLLGVDVLAPPAGAWEMVRATATPHLPLGGPLLIDALVEVLRP